MPVLLREAFMPSSSNLPLPVVLSIIRVLEPRSVLDVGAGMGKYGRLIRMMNAQGLFQTKLTAIEIDAGYVETYKLNEVYDEVIVADALELLKDSRRRYDLVIIGDCIEHLRKSHGIDLLNYLIYRSGYIAMVYPVEYPQDAIGEHEQEAHISVWSETDFTGMNNIHMTVAAPDLKINLALIKGYQKTENSITGFGQNCLQVCHHGNAGTVPFMAA